MSRPDKFEEEVQNLAQKFREGNTNDIAHDRLHTGLYGEESSNQTESILSGEEQKGGQR